MKTYKSKQDQLKFLKQQIQIRTKLRKLKYGHDTTVSKKSVEELISIVEECILVDNKQEQIQNENIEPPSPKKRRIEVKIYCLCQKQCDGSCMVSCDGKCQNWYHLSCVGMCESEYNNIKVTNTTWLCPLCR